TDRRGADYRPHDGSYAMARKFRVPDLNGLAHLASVSGGCFFDLETLHAMTVGENGHGSAPALGGGGGKRLAEDAHGGGGSSLERGRKGEALGVGPSLALCQ
ncbi:unnamed protein product, partial [Ascophyllum nodosum]